MGEFRDMKSKLPSKYVNRFLLPVLKDIERTARLKTANFSGGGRVPYPTNEKEVDAFIKDRIGLWVATWIEYPIKSIIDSIE